MKIHFALFSCTHLLQNKHKFESWFYCLRNIYLFISGSLNVVYLVIWAEVTNCPKSKQISLNRGDFTYHRFYSRIFPCLFPFHGCCLLFKGTKNICFVFLFRQRPNFILHFLPPCHLLVQQQQQQQQQQKQQQPPEGSHPPSTSTTECAP